MMMGRKTKWNTFTDKNNNPIHIEFSVCIQEMVTTILFYSDSQGLRKQMIGCPEILYTPTSKMKL